MKKRSMALSTMGYLLIAVFLFLVLTFIYFGHTGFFRKIYVVTDTMGLTHFAKDYQEKEENITESSYELTPEERIAEETIRNLLKTMAPSIQACIDGTNCVCSVTFPTLPPGYAMRFRNIMDNRVDVSVFRYKSRDWAGDFDKDYQGELGVHFVAGAVHRFENTQICLVVDLEKNWGGIKGVDQIEVKEPYAGMIQLYNKKNKIWLSEPKVTGAVMDTERDYLVYGKNGPPNAMYKTVSKPKPGSLCFFARRFSYSNLLTDNDEGAVSEISCGESEEEDQGR